ncbi:ECM25 Protein ECM25 [Candida maltosa Xu316]
MERIFYKTDLRDPTTNYPIYVFDTSYLPSPDQINYNEFLPIMMNYLPTRPYVLVMFSCGLNKISWIWGIKFLQKFLLDNDEKDLQNLIKIYTIHDSWFIKSITSILYNFHSTKKNLQQLDKLLEAFTFEKNRDRQTVVIHCKTLSQLSDYLDITALKISLNVYKHDIQISELKLSMRYEPVINSLVTLNINTHPVFHHHLYQIFKIVENHCSKVELIFYKPGNKLKSDILYQCIVRNQLIWINDWDLYSIATVFKRVIAELPFPVIDVTLISLPIKDDVTYTLKIFKNIVSNLKSNTETVNYDQFLFQLLDMFDKIIQNTHITKHTPTTLSKCMSYSLSHEIGSSNNSANVQIITRFFRNLLEFWPEIKKNFKIYDIDQTINGQLQNQPVIKLHDTSSYDLSHDITLDQESNEESEPVETTNILQNLTLNNTHGSQQLKSVDKKPSRKLSDVSNVQIQFPPQKYKFTNTVSRKSSVSFTPKTTATPTPITTPVKKPVIRGRKVSELARLFEERSEGIEILRGMS